MDSYLRLSLLSAVFSFSAMAAKPPQYTIASYNVENLWDNNPENTPQGWSDFLDSLTPEQKAIAGKQIIQYGDYALATSNWYTPRIGLIKAQHVLEVLTLANTPDIVGLQEIESAFGNSSVFSSPLADGRSLGEHLGDLGYRYILLGPQEADNPVAVTTAVISKLPLQELPPVPIQLNPYSISGRDIQAVGIDIGGSHLVIFNGHWKSKAGSGSESQRLVFANALRQRITQEQALRPDTRVIVMGDLNSHYFEAPLLALGATADEGKMLQTRVADLYDLWFDAAPEDRWDYSFSGERTILSHMLVSDSLYERGGLHYIDQSFTVIGQSGRAARVLLNRNGQPFRWQVRRSYGKYTHVGQGYSDHLPLVATFAVGSDPSDHRKMQINNPTREDIRHPPAHVMFDRVDTCTEAEAVPVQTLDLAHIEKYVGTCAKIEVAPNSPAIPLGNRGDFSEATVAISYRTQDGNNAVYELGLTMTRAYDWRPNVDDTRVSYTEADLPPGGTYSESNWHPKSNKCFVRKILQGPGGAVRKAIGRLGMDSGEMYLFIASRENAVLTLENLPNKKKVACPWM